MSTEIISKITKEERQNKRTKLKSPRVFSEASFASIVHSGWFSIYKKSLH